MFLEYKEKISQGVQSSFQDNHDHASTSSEDSGGRREFKIEGPRLIQIKTILNSLIDNGSILYYNPNTYTYINYHKYIWLFFRGDWE